MFELDPESGKKAITKNLKIADVYFRLDINQIQHGRIVYSFMDWIMDLGGVPGLLMQVAGLVVGSHTFFNA